MRKTLYFILIPVVIIVSIVFANYIEYTKNKTEIINLNKEFIAYENKNLQINTVVTLMNKAIQKNKENGIPQTEKQNFEPNDTNSIKIYLEIKSRNSMIPMEELLLNSKIGIEKVEYAFSDLIFEISNIEYHEKTGQVKKVIFTAKEEEI